MDKLIQLQLSALEALQDKIQQLEAELNDYSDNQVFAAHKIQELSDGVAEVEEVNDELKSMTQIHKGEGL